MEKSIEARVISYNRTTVDGEVETLFKIEVTKEGHSWNVRRSYEEFREFHKLVKKTQDKMPKLPKKKFMKVTKDEDLEVRRLKLDEYIIDIVKKQDLYTNTNLIKFFEVNFFFKKISVG